MTLFLGQNTLRATQRKLTENPRREPYPSHTKRADILHSMRKTHTCTFTCTHTHTRKPSHPTALQNVLIKYWRCSGSLEVILSTRGPRLAAAKARLALIAQAFRDGTLSTWFGPAVIKSTSYPYYTPTTPYGPPPPSAPHPLFSVSIGDNPRFENVAGMVDNSLPLHLSGPLCPRVLMLGGVVCRLP